MKTPLLKGLSKKLLCAIAPLSVLALSLPAEAANFSQIYAFGDSLVDTGNAFDLTGFPPAPYFEGRYANGPLWTEYLADDLGIPATHFGFGGAWTSREGIVQAGPDNLVPVPGLQTQIDNFATEATDPDALYVLWAGANDYLFGGITDPTEPVANLVNAVNTLSSVGARHFMLVNQPDLGNLPIVGLVGTAELATGLNQLSEFHNQGLAAAVTALDGTGIHAELLDANALIRQSQAGGFGFTNPTGVCTSTPACVADEAVASTYLFWDPVHPTTRAHSIVAQAAREQLADKFDKADNKVSTPEPGVLLGALVLGGLVAGRVKRDRVSA
ncbi:MAG: SGNH/GDSL hydrolase family protein [Cyanobacteria bacterium P01_A01_bin.116]